MFESAHAGRVAGGTNPVQSFQVYVLEYLTFFDDAMSPECNAYSWAYWGSNTPKLDQALRQKLNDMTRSVNKVIKAAAAELEKMGVIYVEGIQDAYNGHRFCEPGASEKQTEYKVWFWSNWAHFNTPSEGPGDPNVADAATDDYDPSQQLLDFVFPGQNLIAAKPANNTPPWEWPGAAKYPDFQSLMAAISAAADENQSTGVAPVPFPLKRSFHPKATAYKEHARALFAAMADNRATGAAGNPNSTSTSSGSLGGTGQQIAVASYINPSGDPAAWNRLIGYPKEKMPILIANVVNGPDSTADTSWTDVITRASASGKTVLGYVRTGYLGVSQQGFTTRLGSHKLADWAAQIIQDVDMWYHLYGNSIGGIFFDEGWPECGTTAGDTTYVDLYEYINDYTKRTHSGALTVLNPGSPIASCFENTMDTLLTFELNYTMYVNSYTGNDWVPKDPRKIWHIIYDVPESDIAQVIDLSKQRGSGFIQLTDETLDNPYNILPVESYIQSVLGGVAGGVPLNNGASAWASGSSAGAVSSLTISTSDYSSATMSWSAASNALGYNVYLGDTVVASVPSTMTAITIGGLAPGSTNAFHICAVGGSGNLGPSSPTQSTTTKYLPGGHTVTNYNATAGVLSTTYKADVLIPYAFVRIYLWDSVECDYDTDLGWPVNFVIDNYVCTHYMVEGTELFKYSGVLPPNSTVPPWSWAKVQNISLVVTGYTYTWTLPLGSSNIGETNKFVVQAQGYNPLTNVFMPDPVDYDCHGSSSCSNPNLVKWCDKTVNSGLVRSDNLTYGTG